jgi:hypothetical protein
MENPVARRNALVTLDVTDETLVYDLETNKAHCLNRSAALIWKLCDGTNNIGDIARRFEETNGGRITEDFVWLGLSQLGESRLLDSTLPPRSAGRSRRQLLKTIGQVSAALPLIASLVAPARLQSLSNCICINPGMCINAIGCPSTTFCNSRGVCAPEPPGPINVEKRPRA